MQKRLGLPGSADIESEQFFRKELRVIGESVRKPDWCSVAEAASVLELTCTQVRVLCRENTLVNESVGPTFIIDTRSIFAYLLVKKGDKDPITKH